MGDRFTGRHRAGVEKYNIQDQSSRQMAGLVLETRLLVQNDKRQRNTEH